jgi:superfamily II helicase
MSKNSNIDDPFDFLDNQPEVHTPESIRERCKKLIQDADGVIPGLRIVGLFSVSDPMICQLAENDFCNHMLTYLSNRCEAMAQEQSTRHYDEDVCPNCAAEELPTMDELDIPEPRGDDDEEDR